MRLLYQEKSVCSVEKSKRKLLIIWDITTRAVSGMHLKITMEQRLSRSGEIGALVGMHLYRHKTKSFRSKDPTE